MASMRWVADIALGLAVVLAVVGVITDGEDALPLLVVCLLVVGAVLSLRREPRE